MNCINVLASLCLVVLLSGVTIAQNDTTTTTPANNSTTTPAVTTTTDKPTTTTVPSNTTTTAKSNTTTAAKTTPTTTLPTTPATTAAPKEPKNTYNGTDGGKQCIQLIAKIDFEIQYEKTKAGNITQDVAIPASFETEAHCGNETQTLKIKFFKDWSLEYTFKKDKDSNYHVSGLILQYVLDNNFPGAVHADAKMNVTFNVKSDYMKANADGYVCKSKIGKDNGGVTINTEDLKYKAFSKKGDFDFKNTGLECSADEDTNSIVPIAVGAALAGLVVIVLIAYLIGRKRTRKTGYESV